MNISYYTNSNLSMQQHSEHHQMIMEFEIYQDLEHFLTIACCHPQGAFDENDISPSDGLYLDPKFYLSNHPSALKDEKEKAHLKKKYIYISFENSLWL